MILIDRYRPNVLTASASRSRLYTSSMIALLACGLPLAVGCSGSAEESVSAATVVSTDAAEAQDAVDSGDDSKQSSRYVSRESLPQHWLVPIGDKDLFFEPPTPSATPVAPTEAKLADAQVRLLGFATVGSGADAVQKAILKFAEKLVYMKVGESHSGVELVSIEERSVNLQQGRERWALALMDQPVTNAPVPYPQRQRAAQTGSSRSDLQLPGEDLPLEPELPTEDFPPGSFGEPSGFAQPGGYGGNARSRSSELPKLPGFDIPDLEPPEVDFPDIPGFPEPRE